MSVASPAIEHLKVTPVRTSSDFAAFVDLPYRLHRHLPLWVPPLRSEQHALLDPRKNPFFEHAEAQLFLARCGDRAVGRITAHTNPAFEAHHGISTGFFGFFDAVDDVKVARSLTDAAAAWLAGHSRTTMLGPVSFTTNDECGLLVDGFDQRPAIMMPYTPVYYPRLLGETGLTKAKDLLAWEFPTTLHQDPRLARAAARLSRSRALTVRPVDLRRFAEEAELIRMLYNTALGNNWGLSPFQSNEFDVLARRLKPFIRPDMVLIGEVDGRPAGFAFSLPDIAPALAAARGRLFTCGVPLGLARFLLTQRHLDRVRLVAMGVSREHRGRGLELLMYLALSKAAHARGLTTAEASWVLEDNHHVNAATTRFGGRVTKRYRLYSRPVAAA
ncbi:N-acetyltransferase [Streptomyces sp. NPDC051577]|uniref:GNAT family N-acetyltransferase n=1 Tax=Streptomyces sp. NPDC051577 TaxID=3155166 RepID=UPI0034160B30